MKYPVVDRRALGMASVFGRPAAPTSTPAGASAPRQLGKAQQDALKVTKADYEKSKELYERIRVNYPNLVQIMGKEKADQAIQQAQGAMNAAMRIHNDSVEVSG